MIKFDIKVDTRAAQNALETFAKKSVPYAVRDTLNDCAFALRKEWQGELKRTFTLRNKFIEGSIRVDKAQGLNVRTMLSRTGSVAPDMDDQEFGATISGKGKHKAIPAPAAAGNAPGGRARTRPIRAGLRVSAINVPRVGLGKYGKRRQNAIMLAIAQRKGERFVLLNRQKGKGKGLFEIRSFSKRKVRMRMLYDLSRGSVVVKPQPTLQRSIKASQKDFERAQYAATLRQLKRIKLFKF